MFDDLPDILLNSFEMTEPNKRIHICQATVELVAENVTCVVEGEIEFYWFPRMGARLKGQLKAGGIHEVFLTGDRIFEARIGGLRVGDGAVMGFTNPSGDLPDVTVTIDNLLIGDNSVAVTRVLFSVPNLRSFIGEFVKRHTNSSGRNRLIFESEKYIITLDLCFDHYDLRRKLGATSGYLLLANGELKSKGNEQIQYREAKEILHAFGWYLSFLNGRRCSPLFRRGIHEDTVLWADYTGYPNSQYKYVHTWPLESSSDGLSDAWLNFLRIWKTKKGDKDFLISAVHWYVEANGHAGLVDGSIIMIQTAIELIYNWYLIERKKLLLGDDAGRIEAANKFRLLLHDLGVSPGFFPELYSNLRAVAADDAPDVLVTIRNALVHGQERKRTVIAEMESLTKAQALHLGIWYVELSMLKILGYSGFYKRRGASHNAAFKESVPWSKPAT